MMSKIICVAAVSLWVLAGCSHKARAEAQTITASSDASGNHPGTADVPGPMTVTCVSAIGDTGGPRPACVVDAPGGGVVKIGDKVTVAAASKVALTCQGQGR